MCGKPPKKQRPQQVNGMCPEPPGLADLLQGERAGMPEQGVVPVTRRPHHAWNRPRDYGVTLIRGVVSMVPFMVQSGLSDT